MGLYAEVPKGGTLYQCIFLQMGMHIYEAHRQHFDSVQRAFIPFHFRVPCRVKTFFKNNILDSVNSCIVYQPCKRTTFKVHQNNFQGSFFFFKLGWTTWKMKNLLEFPKHHSIHKTVDTKNQDYLLLPMWNFSVPKGHRRGCQFRTVHKKLNYCWSAKFISISIGVQASGSFAFEHESSTCWILWCSSWSRWYAVLPKRMLISFEVISIWAVY